MNTRYIITSDKHWFGGGSDITPVYPDDSLTEFHQAFRSTCDRFDPDYYPRFKDWCDRYFYLPHRKEIRGDGGIFFDDLTSDDWEKDFSFVQSVGRTFLKAYPEVIRHSFTRSWSERERHDQLIKRGRYVEFNLLYDRGTLFGLKTGGHPEAIFMSLPPQVKWP